MIGALLSLAGCGEPDVDPPPVAPSVQASPASAEPGVEGMSGPSVDRAANEPSIIDSIARGDLPARRVEDPIEDSTAGPIASPAVGPGGAIAGEAGDEPLVNPPGPDGPTSGTPDAAAPGTPSSPAPASDAAPTDCANALPCRATAFGGALAVTLHAADGDALDGSGPPRVDVVLEALTRDATVALERTSSIVTGGQVLEADTLRLGLPSAPGARDEAAFPLVAGVPINGHATFAGVLVGNPAALDRVTIRLSEAGRATTAAFGNVPFGAERSPPVDCANTLPCEWRAAGGEGVLVLSDAAPLRWNRATRLAVSFSFTSGRPLELALLPNGRVTNGAGETLEPYGRELGGVESRDATPLVHALEAGERVAGRLVPRRAPADGETSLARVEIPLVERRAPRAPRWRPVFLDVPLREPPPKE